MKIIYLLIISSLLFGCSGIMVEEAKETRESIRVVDPFIVNVDSGEIYKIES